MLAHQQERFFVVALRQPVQCEIRRDRCAVPFNLPPTILPDEQRIVVRALSRQDFPMIEPGRVRIKMPLPNQGRLVPGLLQHLWERKLRTIKRPSSI